MKKERLGILVLIILYSVGLTAMFIPGLRSHVLPLSAYTLLISFLVLLNAYRWKNEVLLASALVFTIGFSVEWIGVHTSMLFGTYWYGANLGPKLLHVPLIIGVNWAMLSALTSAIGSKIFKQLAFQVLGSALLMTAMDWLMEPVAVSSDFWHWKNGIIPVYNFVCWFLVSLVTNWIFIKIGKPKVNNTSVALFILLVLFFTIQLLL
jgi:bisanhydrobacterioruberin hydratase